MIDEKELDRRIESGEIDPVHIPRFASTSEIVKYQFCNLIIRYKKENGLKQKDIAEFLGINKSEVSKLFAYSLKEFSQERIFGFIDQMVSCGVDLDVSAAWNSIKLQSAKLHRQLKTPKSAGKIRA